MWLEVSAQVLDPWACTACHSAAYPSGGVDLSSKDATSLWIVPGDPEASRLIQVMQSGAMPPGGPNVAPEALDLVRRWIESGGAL